MEYIKTKEKLELWVPKYELNKDYNGYAKADWRATMRLHLTKNKSRLRDADSGQIVFLKEEQAHWLSDIKW